MLRASASAAAVLTLGLAGCGAAASGASKPDGAVGRAKPLVIAVAPPTALPPGGPPPAAYAPWPAAGHDARHSGAAPVVGPQRGTLKWRRRLEGPVVPGPLVGADGTVYAASNGGVLHALDPKTGRDRWRLDGHGSYGSDLTTSPLLLPRGLLLWPGPGGVLFALDARSGRQRWRLDLGEMGLSPALGAGGVVYVADMGGGLRALDVSGPRPRQRWHISLGGTSYSSPAVDHRDGRTVIYGGADAALVAVRDAGTSAQILWRATTGDTIEVSPSVSADGTVLVGSNDEHLHAYAPTGAPRWQANLGALTYSSSSSLPDGTVAVGDHHGSVGRFALEDGKLIARYVGLPPTSRRRSVGVWTAPAVDARGDVYFGTRVGHIYGFSYRGRRLLDIATGATVDSNPALGPDGSLYVGSEDGMLYAVRGSGPGPQR